MRLTEVIYLFDLLSQGQGGQHWLGVEVFAQYQSRGFYLTQVF